MLKTLENKADVDVIKNSAKNTNYFLSSVFVSFSSAFDSGEIILIFLPIFSSGDVIALNLSLRSKNG